MNPCLNGGTCMELLGSHSCLCAEGFSGAACESKRFFYHYEGPLDSKTKIFLIILIFSARVNQHHFGRKN